MLQQITQKEKKNEKIKIAYESKIYIPKYNTFEKSENFDYHVEAGDEKFERANKIVNIMRSRGLNTEFCLHYEEVEKFFNENPEYNQIGLYNYSNLQNWNDDEISDILTQLCGEEENLLLVYDNLFKEIEYQINLKKGFKEKAIEEDEDISNFQNEYLIYLKSIEHFLSSTNEKRFMYILKPCRIHQISFEWIGYLSEIYFIPWKNYESFEEFSQTKYPWEVISKGHNEEKRVINRKLWNNKRELKKKGIKLMKNDNELVKMEIEELELILGKKQNFYELEKTKYSLNTNEREEKKRKKKSNF
eukprot:gene2512-3218_t